MWQSHEFPTLSGGWATYVSQLRRPLPTLSIDDQTVLESSGDATFTVSLSAAYDQTVTVDYATADGTATAPADYAATSGTLTFNPGDTTQTIDVPIVDDALPEPSETFAVDLSNPSNATIADGEGVGTITDNDTPVSISIDDQTVLESSGDATFTVSLSAAYDETVTVDYATADGTATAPADYAATSGTLTFNPGDTTQTIDVPIVDDALPEPSETFAVDLSNPSNATIADGEGVGTITDNDPPAGRTLTINDPSVKEGNRKGYTVALVFKVRLSRKFNKVVKVSFATADGTATAGSDYIAKSGILKIRKHHLVGKIIIRVKEDKLKEPNETLFVNLANATNAVIADGHGVGTIINDD